MFKVMFKDNELQKIRGRSTYDEDKGKWIIPAFIVKEKEVNLPKLRNNKQFIQENLDKRDIVFEEDDSFADSPVKQNIRETNF